MNKHVLRMAMIALGLGAGHAFAAPYLGLSVGKSDGGDFTDMAVAAQDDVAAFYGYFPLSSTTEESDTSLKLIAGYAATDNLAFEVSYADLGEFTSDWTGTNGASTLTQLSTTEAQAFALDVVGTLPFTDRFGAFAKIGLARVEADLTATATGPGGTAIVTESATDSGVHYGAGLGVNFGNAMLFVEYEAYKVDDDEGDINLKSVNLGLKFKLQ